MKGKRRYDRGGSGSGDLEKRLILNAFRRRLPPLHWSTLPVPRLGLFLLVAIVYAQIDPPFRDKVIQTRGIIHLTTSTDMRE
jgi:hypothetical protein